MRFNTLYVVGSNILSKVLSLILLVSIHYMSLVQSNNFCNALNIISVSIHYMSLVQKQNKHQQYVQADVSIHYMSLVQSSFAVSFGLIINVSIHYMSLVQRLPHSGRQAATWFQYIICRWFNN